MIPKSIHYCWFGRKPIYPLGQRCIESWKKHMPDWNYVLWNEDTLPRELDLPWRFIERYEWAFASDYTRLYAIFNYGGIYMDVDVEVIRSLDPLLENRQFLGYERAGRANNGVCGGEAGAEFFSKAMVAMKEHYIKNNYYIIAPDLCQRVLKENSFSDLTIYPPHVFYPYNPYDSMRPIKQLMNADIKPDTMTIHHWAKGWRLSLWQRTKRFIKIRLS